MFQVIKLDRDMHRIYKNKMKKTRLYHKERITKIKAIRNIRENIDNYYVKNIESNV